MRGKRDERWLALQHKDLWWHSILKVRNAWNERCSKDADGKNPVCNLSNTILTTGKSIRAFRLILHGGALQQIESRLIAK